MYCDVKQRTKIIIRPVGTKQYLIRLGVTKQYVRVWYIRLIICAGSNTKQWTVIYSLVVLHQLIIWIIFYLHNKQLPFTSLRRLRQCWYNVIQLNHKKQLPFTSLRHLRQCWYNVITNQWIMRVWDPVVSLLNTTRRYRRKNLLYLIMMINTRTSLPCATYVSVVTKCYHEPYEWWGCKTLLCRYWTQPGGTGVRTSCT